MKKLFLGILIIPLFSCSNKQEVAETVFEKTFSINIADTVIIDPGKEGLAYLPLYVVVKLKLPPPDRTLGEVGYTKK